MARSLITDTLVDIWLGHRTGSDLNEEACLYTVSDSKHRDAFHMARKDLPMKKEGYMRFIVISDTHTRHHALGVLPEGDVFVHSGDILMSSRLWTSGARLAKYREFNEWLGSDAIRCPRKIVIAGNHDAELAGIGFDQSVTLFSNATYLENSSTIIESTSPQCRDVFIYGTPCSTGTSGNSAFQDPDCYQAAKVNAMSQAEKLAVCSAGREAVAVFVSHGQNRSIRNRLVDKCNLKAHLWGHAHGHHGVRNGNELVSVCSSIMDTRYCPTNPPIVLDLFVGVGV